MMKVQNKIIKRLRVPLLFLVVLISSCSDDYDISNPIGDGDQKSIVMSFQMPRTSTPSEKRTRAIQEADENTIKTIDVLAFKEDGNGDWVYTYKTKGENITNVGTTVNQKQFSVKVNIESYPQQFVLIANESSSIDNISETDVGTEKETLLQELTFSNSGIWNATESDNFKPFPMWGESEPEVITKNTKQLKKSVPVLKGLLRVDIALAESVKNFELKEVYIYNTKSKGYIVPKAENMDYTTFKVTKAQVPAGPHNDYDEATPNEKALKYTINNPKLIEKSIYLMEATAPTEAADDWKKATCLVVGGEYNGTMGWYRIDLFKKEKNEKGEFDYADFLRNHLYRFNIISVKAPGSPDPETAFKNRTASMEVVIKEWEEGNVGDIIFDGEHYVSFFPNREILFGKEASSSTLDIKTDLPDGFQITKITEADGTTPISANGWLTIDKPLGTPLGAPVNGQEEKVEVKVSVTENASGSERIGYIFVEAGRMHVKIKVTQTLDALNVFEFISMKNIDGQGLAIPRKGGLVKVTSKANIEWRVKSQRGDKLEVVTIQRTEGQPQEETVDIPIDALTYQWLDAENQEMEANIKIWIEFDLDGKSFVVQPTEFYQVPYQLSIDEAKTPIPNSVNKYGEFLELEVKGYFPAVPFRVVDESGEVVSDWATAQQTGDVVYNDTLSTRIKFLVYANYSGQNRKLKIQYERPILPTGTQWKDIKELTQPYNGLTLPTDGYKATRGVLGIGAKTGKLRLDGSQGFFGGTAEEDVYMVCFSWGTLFGLKAPKLNASQDRVVTAGYSVGEGTNTVSKSIKDLIAWLPPGFTGDIDHLPLSTVVEIIADESLGGESQIPSDSYLRLPIYIGTHMLEPGHPEFLKLGHGDPCRVAQDEVSYTTGKTYGSYRTPWGVEGKNHEAFNSYGSISPAIEPTTGYYFYKNDYYTGARQYIPAYGIIYSWVIDDETDEVMNVYMADYPDRATRRSVGAYWTSVSNYHTNMPEIAYALAISGMSVDNLRKDGYLGMAGNDLHTLNKFIALPYRCVK